MIGIHFDVDDYVGQCLDAPLRNQSKRTHLRDPGNFKEAAHQVSRERIQS